MWFYIPGRINICGDRYGRLTVVEMLYGYKFKRTYCRCTCDCGNEKIVQMACLRNGNTSSCGCLSAEVTAERSIIDITGEKYGSLTVCKMLRHYKNNLTYCECKCDCGKENVIIPMNSLRMGDKKSCGCLNHNLNNRKKQHICAVKQITNKSKERINKKRDVVVSKKRLKNDYNRKDLQGMKFNYLTVVEASDKRTKNGSIIWKCICECGNYHYAPSRDLLTGKVKSCGCKRTSQYEVMVEQILNEFGIQYQKQMRFSDCKNKIPLPFDFYLSDYCVCIECQGQQHYKPIKFFGGVDKFERQKKNDSIKKYYCINNDITLLEVIYDMSFDEIKTLIANVINPVTITA